MHGHGHTDTDMHGDGRNARDGRTRTCMEMDGTLLCLLAVRGGHGDLNLTCVHAGASCSCLVVTICSWLSARFSDEMQRAAWHGIDTAWSRTCQCLMISPCLKKVADHHVKHTQGPASSRLQGSSAPGE